jgi:HEAT repeat protein
VRIEHGILLSVLLLGSAGCGHTASSAGGQPRASSSTVSVEPATTEFAATLAVQAMDTSLSQAQRREAATRMMTAAEPDAAIPSMRILLATSDDASVRELMAKRLGDLRNIDSSPQLLDALADTSPSVQEAAAHSLLKMLGRDFFFRSDEPPALQSAAQARYRKYWEHLQASPSTLARLRERNKELRREREQQVAPSL